MDKMPTLLRNIVVTLLLIVWMLPASAHMVRAVRGMSVSGGSENRVLAGWPRWNELGMQENTKHEASQDKVKQYTSLLDAYVNDNFGLRELAIRLHAKLSHALGSDEGGTIAGSEGGWLFLAHPSIWLSYGGKLSFTQQNTDKFLREIAQLQEKIESQGGVFASIFPPDKARIYSEYAPERYGQASPRRFVASILKHPDRTQLHVLDIEPALRRAKSDGYVYYKTDTHWTGRGAYEGYRAAMEAFNRGDRTHFISLTRSQLVEIARENYSGDLALLRGLSGELTEDLIDLGPPQISQARQITTLHDDDKIREWRTRISTNNKEGGTTLVIIGDSFANVLLQFFEHSFDRVILLHHKNGRFNLDEVLNYQPDAVLFAPAERNLLKVSKSLKLE
ncbi:MAG TPA: hypothetical protein ENJ46_02715 [Hellea balneolensis]|uniref:AlgX/AlgJ SGNH hydrolase-like domain-containing protein n=1 Tax=Hellea balneolensis TaxID=287478 RepID=A0A7C3FZP0_9PROT|nr:hypothetical protein [Hellea balneolensis]